MCPPGGIAKSGKGFGDGFRHAGRLMHGRGGVIQINHVSSVFRAGSRLFVSALYLLVLTSARMRYVFTRISMCIIIQRAVKVNQISISGGSYTSAVCAFFILTKCGIFIFQKIHPGSSPKERETAARLSKALYCMKKQIAENMDQ